MFLHLFFHFLSINHGNDKKGEKVIDQIMKKSLITGQTSRHIAF